MEKFKEVVIKLANNVPNKPLPETQNTLIHERFNQFLSVLHTPDHPPYAWMIERALRELNEKRGSSEESISNFIRKEYDDLPWSHFTLLKHHLQALCECGDIIPTRGHYYLLAGADSTLNSGENCRRKPKRKKRDCASEIKRRKRHKNDISKETLLQKEDQVHEKQNCMIEGLELQKLEAEGRKDTQQLCIVGEDGEQMEGDCIEITTPERPPGFESETLEKLCHSPACCMDNPSQGMHPTRKPPEVAAYAAEGLSGQQEQIHVFNVNDQRNHGEEHMILSTHGTPETSVDQTLQEVQPVSTTNGIDLQQTKYENHPAMPSQARPTELDSQKKLPESELTMENDATSITEPVNLAGGKQLTRIVFKYSKRPPVVQAATEKDLTFTMQEIKEELLQQRRRLKCQGQKLHDNPTSSSFLQHEPQEHEILDTNELREVKSGTSNRSEHQGLAIQVANPSSKEHHASKAITEVPEGPAASPKLSICSKQPSGGNAHEFSPLPRPSELEPTDIEEALQTARMQRQKKRWCKQLSNPERPQYKHLAPLESSRVTRKQLKLSSQEERIAGQPQVVLASSVALKQAKSQEFSKLASLKMHTECESQIETSETQPERRVSQEKPSGRILRPRPRKREQSNAITSEFSPPEYQHGGQQQPKFSRHGRPPKVKPNKGVHE